MLTATENDTNFARAANLGVNAAYAQLRRNILMRRFCFALVIGAMLASIGLAQQAPTAGPYKVLKNVKAGGDGGFDYVYADVAGRRLYIPRTGATPRITVFNLDT